ncbi:MAG: peptidase M23 [Bergeyella sp.]|nr:peptidase M23 [Bergeyella sp.]
MTRKMRLLLTACFVSALFFTQSTEDKKLRLQKQNIILKNQIAEINNSLANTKKQSKLSIAYLNKINSKIKLRENLYKNTQKEKKILEDEIYLKQLEINRQKRELKVLRKNYAKVLVNAYKNKGVQNKVTFILSSKNLKEALRRVRYLRKYSDYQNKKAKEIGSIAKEIENIIAQKQKSVDNKNKLLDRQKNELLTIEAEKKQKEKLLEEFIRHENELTARIKQKQKESKNLEARIKNIIAEEIRIAKAKEKEAKRAEAERIRRARIIAEREKARIEAENRARLLAAAEAKRKAQEEANRLAEIERKKYIEASRAKAEEETKKKNDAKIASENTRIAREKLKLAKKNEEEISRKKEEAKKLAEAKTYTAYGIGTGSAANFLENKGRIPFPVNSRNITHFFGKRPHPVFKNIMEENIGIKIAVPPGTIAKCVFSGEVSKIFVDGGTKNVMVRHGNYFTIYSNLSNVSVSAGQKVASGSAIGTVAEDYEGGYTLDFQIWNKETPLNPLEWLSR